MTGEERPTRPRRGPFKVYQDPDGKLWSDKCLRCGKKWLRRQATEPVQCPGCRNSYWSRARLNRAHRTASGPAKEFFFEEVERKPPKPRKRRKEAE